jgi:titin
MQRVPIGIAAAAFAAILLAGCDSNHPTESSVDDLQPSLARGASPDLAAPSNAVATASSQTQIDVRWQDNSPNETRFEIQRSIASPYGSFTLLASTGGGVTSYADAGLPAGSQYCYRIRAVRVTGNKIVNSAFSNTACPTSPPAAPSNVYLIGSASAISVQWRDNSSNESLFEVHVSNGDPSGPFGLLGTSGPNMTWYDDGGLIEGTARCYIVRAVQTVADTQIASPFSSVVCGTAVPGPATATTATPQNSFLVRVQWTAVGLDFRIDRSTDGGANWTTIGTASNTRSFYDQVQGDFEGPYIEAEVCYRVISYTATYNAEPSNTDCTTPPARPTSVVVTAIDASTRELTWTDNSGVEDGYEVRDLFPDCWSDWDGNVYCDGYTEVVVAVLPANTTSYRMSRTYSSGMSVVAMKDGGYSTAGWWLPE